MTHGGKRMGAGRKLGINNRPQLYTKLSERQISDLLRLARRKALEGDTRVLIFLLEQIYGKARQAVDMTSAEEKIPTGFEHLTKEQLDEEIERLYSNFRSKKVLVV